LALVGDWGTGNYTPGGPALDVMNQIVKPKPDYILHLGDVYYSGTGDEERHNLLAAWPPEYSGKSFTLNSNHEMYDGGYGYFHTTLPDPIFSVQNGTSYFVLNYGDASHGGPWTILVLDSAYWSTSALVTDGSITDPDSSCAGATAQVEFISALLSPKKVIVVTHHNPISYDGSEVVDDLQGNSLWEQVTNVLGEPAGWYWGHVHNAIVYSLPTAVSSHTRARCIGHGAIPFGPASGPGIRAKSGTAANPDA